MSGTLGLDIGGANLKAATADGFALTLPFALWRDPAGLVTALARLLDQAPPAPRLAITMTGELCDCYPSRRLGVAAILDAVAVVAGGRPVSVWTTGGRFVSPEEVRRDPLRAAAANWLALATFAGRFAATDRAVLIDIGSTTTDIIPLRDGRPVPHGWDDVQRLRTGELVYAGVRRTPVCSLLSEAVCAELFATTLDVYLALGDLPPDAADRDTADGRPATAEHAHARLARMLGGDGETLTPADTRHLALMARDRQVERTRAALRWVCEWSGGLPATVIASGSGEWLVKQVLGYGGGWESVRRESLSARLGSAGSSAACARAVAVLADEEAFR